MNRKKIIQILTSLAVLGCLLPAHAANVTIPPVIEMLLLNPAPPTSYMSDRSGNKKDFFLTTDIEACVTTPVVLNNPTPFKIEWFDPDSTSYSSNYGIIPAGVDIVTDCILIAGNPPANFPGKWGVTIDIAGTTYTRLDFDIQKP